MVPLRRSDLLRRSPAQRLGGQRRAEKSGSALAVVCALADPLARRLGRRWREHGRADLMFLPQVVVLDDPDGHSLDPKAVHEASDDEDETRGEEDTEHDEEHAVDVPRVRRHVVFAEPPAGAAPHGSAVCIKQQGAVHCGRTHHVVLGLPPPSSRQGVDDSLPQELHSRVGRCHANSISKLVDACFVVALFHGHSKDNLVYREEPEAETQ
mmetsp:Transcript_127372/g.317928  ORF Transcript_127372/g.317928 Transcript_127372/m.317928 type:complete len:210 (+) Transcript_127372:852-1481(+)